MKRLAIASSSPTSVIELWHVTIESAARNALLRRTHSEGAFAGTYRKLHEWSIQGRLRARNAKPWQSRRPLTTLRNWPPSAPSRSQAACDASRASETGPLRRYRRHTPATSSSAGVKRTLAPAASTNTWKARFALYRHPFHRQPGSSCGNALFPEK